MEKHPKILIVEDDQDIRENIVLYLQSIGCLCLEAVDGHKALEIAKKENLDLIFLDIILPGLNGYQVCKALRSDPKYKSIPIIMLSAKAAQEDKEWAKKLGSTSYIVKPFELSDLETTIIKHVKK